MSISNGPTLPTDPPREFLVYTPKVTYGDLTVETVTALYWEIDEGDLIFSDGNGDVVAMWARGCWASVVVKKETSNEPTED
jgi:hypothetical protein